jgi:hypothetical protein
MIRALRTVCAACCSLFFPTAVGLVACTSTANNGLAEATGALRLLAANEVVGELAASTPRYRAFRFLGRQGDSVEAWVRSPEGDALGFMLAADFKTLATNDDASGATRDARMELTLPNSGTYYVAFRDADFEPTRMTVTLTRLSATGPVVDGGAASDGGGAGSSVGDASDASDDGGAQRTIAQFSQVLAETVCAEAARCCSATDRAYVLSRYIQASVDPKECVAKLTNVLIARNQKWAAPMTRGTIRFDASRAAQCVLSLRTPACGGKLLTPMFDSSLCSSAVFIKEAKLGATCQDIGDATFSGECDPALGFCGTAKTCEAWAKTGQACSLVGQRRFCAPGLACDGGAFGISGTCSAPLEVRKVGESCAGALCEVGAYCDSVGGVLGTERCLAGKAPGAPCTTDEECGSTTPFSCNPISQRCDAAFCAGR